MSAPTRWLAAAGLVIALALIASVGVAILGTDEAEFPEGSAERAVQQYLRAVAERDAGEALEFLSPSVRERCGDFPRDMISRRGNSDLRATLEETEERGTTVEVRVSITETYGDPPFGGGDSTFSEQFVLAEEGGAWRFLETPWPLYCPARVEPPAPGLAPAVPVPASTATAKAPPATATAAPKSQATP